jgi:predicted MFS family arabinose efflux permease
VRIITVPGVWPPTLDDVRTYGEVFRVPEFTPLFATYSLWLAGSTVSGLALGVLVYTATSSPLLAALAMFGPSLAQIAGASALLSAADRYPPRLVLASVAAVMGLATLGQSVPGLPAGAILGISLLLGIVVPLASGARFGLLNDILPADGYVLGRSMLNMASGIIQVAGFGIGGLLVTLASPRGALVVGAACYLAGAVGTRLFLRRRPPRASGRPSVGETWRVNRLLWSSVPARYAYLALWVPNGLIVGCEALFVSYSPQHAGLMFAANALGMLAGDTLVGRFVPSSWRARLGPWLRLLLAGPYVVFAFHPALPVVMAATCVASVGYSASLMLQERLMKLTPDELSGHAMGLQSSGMQAMQGVGALVAGLVAQSTSPASGMVVMAAASVVVTLLLARGLRGEPAVIAGSGPALIASSGPLAGAGSQREPLARAADAG